ncbi:universal stress protein [uncultured Bifidobacterium sp.]|uniref:universal stress protein n=1 Tax=uncultured Bifidobacterium sp. TaxID=165187 RepID=UPI0028DD034A|nr:universal stress protein [uncultured Bifidobacterium sp.]
MPATVPTGRSGLDARYGRSRSGDVVVGVDGSPESFAALRWALSEASALGLPITVVYGWTHSWDMGPQPDDDTAWEAVSDRISRRLREWASKACEGVAISPEELSLVSVHSSGTSALLRLGSSAQQIVVGRRSLGRVARWFTGSLSASLAEEARVPVTIVRTHADDREVRDAIATALSPDPSSSGAPGEKAGDEAPGTARAAIVVGLDGSPSSRRALRFAAEAARVHARPLHALFCWQLRDLGEIPGYENAVAPLDAAQRHAESVIRRVVQETGIDDRTPPVLHAFHIPAAKGLIDASRYASRVVVGSRGLSGLDAHFMGSVSRQVVSLAECTVTVVH